MSSTFVGPDLGRGCVLSADDDVSYQGAGEFIASFWDLGRAAELDPAVRLDPDLKAIIPKPTGMPGWATHRCAVLLNRVLRFT